MLVGKQVTLGPVETYDLTTLKTWRNHAALRQYFREYREINDAMQQAWFERYVLNDPATLMFAIHRRSDDKLIGCGGLAYIHWVHRHAEISLYIGEDAVYIDDQGFAEESCRLLLRYAFLETGLNKVWSEVYEFDHLKIDLYQKVGFQQDGLLRQHCYHQGRWWNSHILSLLADNYNPEE